MSEEEYEIDIDADLEEDTDVGHIRQPSKYTPMTTEDMQAWNARVGLRPQSEKHWMSVARKEAAEQEAQNREELERQQRLAFLAAGWKRLAYVAQYWRDCYLAEIKK